MMNWRRIGRFPLAFGESGANQYDGTGGQALVQNADGDRGAQKTLVMLVVGNLRMWHSTGRQVPQMPGFHFVGYDDVTAHLLADLCPDVVLSALLGENFDALELARRLRALGFAGRYRALTNGLPNPNVVRQEVRSAVPELDFDLFIIDDPEAPQDVFLSGSAAEKPVPDGPKG